MIVKLRKEASSNLVESEHADQASRLLEKRQCKGAAAQGKDGLGAIEILITDRLSLALDRSRLIDWVNCSS